jgi:hypothetical protein
MSLPGSRRRSRVVGGTFLAGFSPDVLTGILARFQGFNELLGSRQPGASSELIPLMFLSSGGYLVRCRFGAARVDAQALWRTRLR